MLSLRVLTYTLPCSFFNTTVLACIQFTTRYTKRLPSFAITTQVLSPRLSPRSFSVTDSCVKKAYLCAHRHLHRLVSWSKHHSIRIRNQSRTNIYLLPPTHPQWLSNPTPRSQSPTSSPMTPTSTAESAAVWCPCEFSHWDLVALAQLVSTCSPSHCNPAHGYNAIEQSLTQSSSSPHRPPRTWIRRLLPHDVRFG